MDPACSTVTLTGWRYGLNKVALTKLIREQASLGLSEAKACTNRLLAGEDVVIALPSPEAARAFADGAQAIRAVCGAAGAAVRRIDDDDEGR